MTTDQTSPFVTMLRFTKRLHASGYSPREVLILSVVAYRGGIDGLTVSGEIGMPPRQVAHAAIRRLMRAGFVEDRREEVLRGVPQRLFITPAGRTFFMQIFKDPADGKASGALPAGE